MRKLLFILLTFGMANCVTSQKETERPNILWITHEDISPIYGCYGDKYAHTPNIDRFTTEGIFISGILCRSCLITKTP